MKATLAREYHVLNLACCFHFQFKWQHYDKLGVNTEEEAVSNIVTVAALNWQHYKPNNNSDNEPILQQMTETYLESISLMWKWNGGLEDFRPKNIQYKENQVSQMQLYHARKFYEIIDKTKNVNKNKFLIKNVVISEC